MKKILVCFLFVFLIALFSGCHVEEAESSFPDVTADASLGEESSSAESSEEVSYPVIPGLYECYLTGARPSNDKTPHTTTYAMEALLGSAHQKLFPCTFADRGVC